MDKSRICKITGKERNRNYELVRAYLRSPNTCTSQSIRLMLPCAIRCTYRADTGDFTHVTWLKSIRLGGAEYRAQSRLFWGSVAVQMAKSRSTPAAKRAYCTWTFSIRLFLLRFQTCERKTNSYCAFRFQKWSKKNKKPNSFFLFSYYTFENENENEKPNRFSFFLLHFWKRKTYWFFVRKFLNEKWKDHFLDQRLPIIPNSMQADFVLQVRW